MDFAAVLSHKYEGRRFAIGDTYESIRSLDGGPIPSLQELEALWPEVQRSLLMAQVEIDRQAAYRLIADPIFFKYQRGEATEQEWLDSVAQVKTTYPYP